MVMHSEDIVSLSLNSLRILHGDLRLVDNVKLKTISVHDELKGA